MLVNNATLTSERASTRTTRVIVTFLKAVFWVISGTRKNIKGERRIMGEREECGRNSQIDKKVRRDEEKNEGDDVY